MAINGLDSMMAAFSAGQANKGVFQKTTVNGAASAAGRWHEFFTSNGIPAAGAFSGTAEGQNSGLGFLIQEVQTLILIIILNIFKSILIIKSTLLLHGLQVTEQAQRF